MLNIFTNEYPYTDFHELNLSWLLQNYKKLVDGLKQIDGWISVHEKEYKELKKYIDALDSGNFTPEYAAALTSWIQQNAYDIIGQLIKMVFFGLNDEGYFVAYIPEGWDDIIFGTSGLDDFPVGIDYGHLTLSY